MTWQKPVSEITEYDMQQLIGQEQEWAEDQATEDAIDAVMELKKNLK